ncbi:MAG: hypothetical protein IPP30_07130 [Flavobacterium sp.]|nr:hypothetical protein [Flavobacterium sp.]
MKKTLLLVLFLNVIISSAQTLDFTNKTNMPSARSGSAMAEFGDFAYVVGGFSATEPYTSEIYQYNFATDTWTTFSTNIPLIPKRYANAEVLSGKLYVFNGETATGVNNKLEIIDLITGEVTIGPDNPNPVFQGGSGVDRLFNTIVAFGGCNNSANAIYSDMINYFFPTNNAWTVGGLNLMQTPTTTKGRMINAKLYYMGGYSENNQFTEDFETAATTGNLAITNWTNVAETGTKLFQGKTFSSNIYAQATAFDSNILTREASNKIWLISDQITKPAESANEESFLSFQTLDGFNNGATLEAYIIINWTGDITTSTKTLLSATIASGSTIGFAQSFTYSGNLSLANFPSTFRVAFKYSGGYEPVATTTYQIDNVRVFTAVTSNSITGYDFNNPPAYDADSLTQPVSAHAVALDAMNNIFVVGDYDNQTFLGKFNTSDDTFASLNQTNMIARRHCTAAVWNNQLFIFGGNTASAISSALNSTQSADVSNLGIEDIRGNSGFMMYPNPVKDNLYFVAKIQLLQ